MQLGLAFIAITIFWAGLYALHTKFGKLSVSQNSITQSQEQKNKAVIAPIVFFYIAQILGFMLLYTNYVGKWFDRPTWDQLFAVGLLVASTAIVHLRYVRRSL